MFWIYVYGFKGSSWFVSFFTNHESETKLFSNLSLQSFSYANFRDKHQSSSKTNKKISSYSLCKDVWDIIDIVRAEVHGQSSGVSLVTWPCPKAICVIFVFSSGANMELKTLVLNFKKWPTTGENIRICSATTILVNSIYSYLIRQ